MDAAMKSMNLEKISNLMDKFEQQFEDLDVQSGVMENAMSQNVTTMVPQNDVDSLMQQVADEAGYALLKPKYVHVFIYVFIVSDWSSIWSYPKVLQTLQWAQPPPLKCHKNKTSCRSVLQD